MTSSTTHKARENRLRRMADRQGLALRKSRVRDPYAPEYGQMWLMTERVWSGSRWELVAGPEGSHDVWAGPFDSLEDVEAYLTADPETRDS